MKVAIIGSRKANISHSIIIPYIPELCDEIISGGSGTVDLLAEKISNLKKIKFKCFLPNYKMYGRNAPLVRNIKIIEYSDLILAFWDKKSTGTKFVIKESIKRNIPIKVIYI